MINRKLSLIMSENNIFISELAQVLNISEKTMLNKLKNPSLFTLDQITATYKILDMTTCEAIEIFFPRTFESMRQKACTAL